MNFFFSTGETGAGHGTSAGSTNADATQLRNSPVEVMEDDDHELQMALAASISNKTADRPSFENVSFQPPPFRPPAQPIPPHLLRSVQNVTDAQDDELERAMRLSAAQRRQDLESDAQLDTALHSSGVTSHNQATFQDHSDGEDATEQAFIEAAIKESLEHPQVISRYRFCFPTFIAYLTAQFSFYFSVQILLRLPFLLSSLCPSSSRTVFHSLTNQFFSLVWMEKMILC